MSVCVRVCVSGIHAINSQPIELGVVPIDSEFSRECPEQKNSEKVVMLWRDLMIANQKKVPAANGSNRHRISQGIC